MKYEDVYLGSYTNLLELIVELTEYFAFCNGERSHQSLGNRMPSEVYATASRGGARIIVDKFSGARSNSPATLHREITPSWTGVAPSSCV